MPSLINGNSVEQTAELRYAELPEIFEDSDQVGSDWYTLAVRKRWSESLLRIGCNATRVQ
jgi:hypothetical protein